MNTVTYTVAQCSEFHIMGKYYDDIQSLKEAVQLFDHMEDRNMIKALGINIRSDNFDDTQFDFYYANHVDLSYLECYEEIMKNDKALNMIAAAVAERPGVSIQNNDIPAKLDQMIIHLLSEKLPVEEVFYQRIQEIGRQFSDSTECDFSDYRLSTYTKEDIKQVLIDPGKEDEFVDDVIDIKNESYGDCRKAALELIDRVRDYGCNPAFHSQVNEYHRGKGR